MGEPLKAMFDRAIVRRIATRLAAAGTAFPRARFTRRAAAGLEELELKARVEHIVDALDACLDPHPPHAFEHLLAASDPPGQEREAPWHWPLCTYVERHSLDWPDEALEAMRELTRRFSCEFAIRPLLAARPGPTLAFLEGQLRHADPRVRRWISEGTRPRLPWGPRLAAFVADPGPVLALLEALRDDPSETVRRSVANNLNDMAKDHPDRIARLARRWLSGASRERERLVRHALRTLVKDGHAGALAALGVGPARLKGLSFEGSPEVVERGRSIEMRLAFESTADQELVIDFIVHYVKASGRTSPKVFKWRRRRAARGEAISLEKRHAMKDVSIRTLHAGRHRIEVAINGRAMASFAFELVDRQFGSSEVRAR